MESLHSTRTHKRDKMSFIRSSNFHYCRICGILMSGYWYGQRPFCCCSDGFSPGPVVITKTMSPCSIWQGLWAAAQERRCLCVHRRGNQSPLRPLSQYRGFNVYSMNKTGGRRKMFITRVTAASWLSSCSAPSQPLLKPLLYRVK
jgi:hypothetical protein